MRAPRRAPTYSLGVLDHGGLRTEQPRRRSRAAGALRARASGHRHLLTGSALLVITVGVNAVSGALFWLVAARTDTQTDVGHATALFTSLLFVAFVAGLGLLVALARYAGGRTRTDDVLFTWSCLATSAAAVLVALIYLRVAGAAAVDELREWSAIGGPAMFIALAAGTALSLLADVRFMTQRRWGLVLGRAGVAAAARFPLLAIPVEGNRAIWLVICVAAPNALTGFISVAALPGLTGGRHRLSPWPEIGRQMIRYSAVNWISTLTYQAPSFVMPVIVLLNVDADTNASFYVAWGVANLACYVPIAIGQALLAEGGRDGAQVRSQVRLAVVLATGLMAVGFLLTVAGKDIVTSLYGEDYAEAARILPMLVLAGVPWAITSVYLTEARVRHNNAATVVITGVLSVCILGGAAVLVPRDGLDGATAAFLGGNLIAAAVAIVAHFRMRGGAIDPTSLETFAEEALPVGHGP